MTRDGMAFQSLFHHIRLDTNTIDLIRFLGHVMDYGHDGICLLKSNESNIYNHIVADHINIMFWD